MLLKEKLNSKLKKAELVERVAAMLLNPDVMFCRMSIFDDRAIEIFEKGIGKFYRFTDDERDTVSILNEMDLAVVGEDDAGEDIVFVFDDVAEVWQGVKNEKFEAYRKRASWVWKCLYWTEEMYGYTPIENFLDGRSELAIFFFPRFLIRMICTISGLARWGRISISHLLRRWKSSSTNVLCCRRLLIRK